MDKNQAIEICKKYLPVWERFKKDSTTRELSVHEINELNMVHRFSSGHFANIGCSECVTNMFRRVFNFYERESKIETPQAEQQKPDYTAEQLEEMDYKSLTNIAREKQIKLKRNILKPEIIELILNHKP